MYVCNMYVIHNAQCTYVNEILVVALIDVVENGGFVEISESSHVFHSFDASWVHRHHIVLSQLSTREA